MTGLVRGLLAASVLLVAPMALAGPRYAVTVEGLSCPFCAYGIEKSLTKIDGVATIETRIADGTVVIEMQGEQALERAVAEDAVRRAGFDLVDFERIGEDGVSH